MTELSQKRFELAKKISQNLAGDDNLPRPFA